MINSNIYENNNFHFDRPHANRIKHFTKYLVVILKGWLLHLLFTLTSKKPSPKKYQYSICSIFKNEGPYIKEWIEFHLLIGFQHFYLYQNNSTDNYAEVLKPYIEQGLVTLIEWPEIPGQLSSYKHWYQNYRHETQWVSFLDLDEFICPKRASTIDEWMEPFKKYPIVMLYWKMFGTSGIIDHNGDKLVIEQYIICWEKKDNIGKLIYNTDYEISNFFLAMMHSFKVKYCGLSIPPINQYGYFVDHDIHRYNKLDTIQVNHYWSKSYGNYLAKHARGSAAFGKSWKTFDKFLYHEHFNTSSDFNIYRFLTQLKLKISNNYPINKD